jgi:hypothetical protein
VSTEFDAEYVEICCQLKLPRPEPQVGDLALLWHDEGLDAFGARRLYLQTGNTWKGPEGYFRAGRKLEEDDIWIPRLEDWLWLLKAVGVPHVVFTEGGDDRMSRHLGLKPGVYFATEGYTATAREGEGSTWKIAAARLYQAVLEGKAPVDYDA